MKGQEGAHKYYSINGAVGQPLSNSNLRKALQFLIYSSTKLYKKRANYLEDVDPQIYLPLQPGRLSEGEAIALINEGKNFVGDLQIYSKKHPLRVHSPSVDDPIFQLLKDNDIAVASESGLVSRAQSIEWDYSQNPPFDVLATAASVVSGDPDGLYHLLGKSGAILAPVNYREKVGSLLEEGRQILEPEKLKNHYQQVSKAILQEVPLIHVGFSRIFAAYRNDLVNVGDINLKRNEGHLDLYSHKKGLGF